MEPTMKSERQMRFAVVGTVAVHAALLLTAYLGLVWRFEFPQILREPTDVMLAAFRANQSIVVACYAAFTWSQVAFCVVVLAIRERSAANASPWLRAASSLGVIAGFAQAIGFSRWTFAVPGLAEIADQSPETVEVTLATLHDFAGVAVGEHLFFCFEALWAVGLAIHLIEHPGRTHVSKAGAVLLLCVGIGIAVYSLEQFGGVFAVLGPLNVIAHGVLLFW